MLVAAGVLAGLVVLARLFARRFALLTALGAPRRFIFAVMRGYTATLILASAALGLLCGYLAVSMISQVMTRRTDILVEASLGWPELHLVVAFLSLTLLLALLPAASAYGRSVVADLRTHLGPIRVHGLVPGGILPAGVTHAAVKTQGPRSLVRRTRGAVQ